ncbi:hypothetical protein NQ314_009033, partial [Rhamnusium bicolor]
FVMEDSLSVKSNESVATSEEFDFVGDKPGVSKTPTLDFKNGDLSELTNALTEVLQEPDSNMNELLENDGKKIGHSTFYGCPVEPGKDPLSMDGLSPTEKQDSMKPDTSSEEEGSSNSLFEKICTIVSDVDQECTIFSGVTYLGAAAINAPKSEAEIQRNMAILNEQSTEQGIKISVSVPSSSQGLVVILFYARGSVESPEAGCFAFTWSHGDSQESAIFQCHVFRCDIAEAVSRVSACFAKAFQRVPRSMSSSVTSAMDMMTGSITTLSEARTLMYVFEVNLEIKEDDGKGSFSTVGKDKNGFKLKANLERQLCLSIRQVSDNGPQLFIERCFGVLVAAGRHVRHSDMQLLEMKEQVGSNSTSHERNCTLISASWDPTEASFEPLNVETPKELKQYMTVAVDLVIRGIQEPVRFQIETPVRIFGQNERNFWYFQRKSLIQQFFLNLKEVVSELNDVYYEVLSMETSGELDRNLLNLNLNLSSLIQSPSITSIDTLTPKEEYHSDGDEPLLSGTGLVSKDCSEDVLESWADVLQRWKSTKQKPKQLAGLVRLGIPEALRGEESSCENVIQRDIARTFPAHDFFKEAGGLGQDSLYRVSKAYAAFDSEVGYCQGLSFLAATLLLHMPEEQAFCVLVKLMYDYGLRDLYKDGFDNLYLRLYQLNRLMEEQLAPLWLHFAEHHIETHIFVKKDLLQLDFEGILKYFRVSLPKKCRTEESAKQLIKLACSLKVKKLKKYEADFIALKEAADHAEKEASEVEQLRLTVARYEEERKLMLDEISQLKDMLKREVNQAEVEKKTSMTIINDYKQIRQRLDTQLHTLKAELEDIKVQVSNCDGCSTHLQKQKDNSEILKSNIADQVNADERIRELELELAQTKLAHVEAECRNQNLTHQLRATELELNTAKNSWPPWLSKTLSSIKEVANKKDFPNFTVSQSNIPNTTPTFISHVNAVRRDSVPLKHDKFNITENRRESAPVIKDSQSCSSLKTHN